MKNEFSIQKENATGAARECETCIKRERKKKYGLLKSVYSSTRRVEATDLR